MSGGQGLSVRTRTATPPRALQAHEELVHDDPSGPEATGLAEVAGMSFDPLMQAATIEHALGNQFFDEQSDDSGCLVGGFSRLSVNFAELLRCAAQKISES
ncbi:hypothetical protein MGN01_18560 [Methylobacterium gnaphalii]|uniref:Uncharacterized protein n=1 Tax=Methylobacterium gnaphalii TaxID=1010610 RepID=A0A512JJ79_9HYPH|nr:hypothetical protein MGN01_18560 [Methylobacterium gnaphalii]GLS48281.1 hypothetical protein GCM10007885_11250 [Methylobacterium gnaphalii]